MRSAVGQANNAYNDANNTATGLGASASGISANLTPFLTQEMLHPQGLGQQGVGAEEAAALGGAGGAASGLTGQAMQRAATSRNAGGYQAALSDAARSRDKAAAGASEGIAAGNEQDKMRQQQEGAEGLGGMYKTDTSGMLQAMGQEAPDINSEVNASKSGWLQNTMGILNGLNGAASTAMTGFKMSQ
jgi:hypothetical protein